MQRRKYVPVLLRKCEPTRKFRQRAVLMTKTSNIEAVMIIDLVSCGQQRSYLDVQLQRARSSLSCRASISFPVETILSPQYKSFIPSTENRTENINLYRVLNKSTHMTRYLPRVRRTHLARPIQQEPIHVTRV